MENLGHKHTDNQERREGRCIENVHSRKTIDMEVTSVTYATDVAFLTSRSFCQTTVNWNISHLGACVLPKQQSEGGAVFTNEGHERWKKS